MARRNYKSKGVKGEPAAAVAGGVLPFWRRYPAELLVVGVLVLAIWGVFGRTLGFGFVDWDDTVEVVTNPHIESLDGEHLRWMWTNFDYVRRYQPLDWMSWAGTYAAWGRDPFGYHLGNVAEHMVGAVLLFFLIRKLLLVWGAAGGGGSSEVQRVEVQKGGRRVLAFCAGAGALWWAVHPLRAEAVAWVTDRIYTQCSMLLWAFLLCYLYAVDEGVSRGVRRGLMVLAVVFFGAALLSYSIIVGAAVVLVVLDIYPLRRFSRDGRNVWWGRGAWGIYLEKAPFFLMALAVGLVTLYARAHAGGMWRPPPGLKEFGVMERVMQAFYTWAYYVWVPWRPTQLSPVYTRLVQFSPWEAGMVVSGAVVVGVTGVLVVLRRRVPGLAALWAYHLVMLVPLLGLSEHPHYTSDRYAHMAGLAWAVLLAGGLWSLWGRMGWGSMWPRVAGVAMGVVIVVMGAMCYQQTIIWRNSETLFTSMIEELGNDNYRGDICWRRGQGRMLAGDYAGAIGDFDVTIKLAPVRSVASVKALSFKAQSQTALQDWEGAEKTYRKWVEMMPNESAYNALALLRVRAGNLAQGAAYLEESLKLNAEQPDVHYCLAGVLLKEGRKEEAEGHLREALRENPGFKEAREMLGQVTAGR